MVLKMLASSHMASPVHTPAGPVGSLLKSLACYLLQLCVFELHVSQGGGILTET